MLQSLVPSAEMVKFAKDGSTILTAGIKLARAIPAGSWWPSAAKARSFRITTGSSA